MPDPARLTPLGQAMLAQLPPALRSSTDYMAVIHAYAKEVELAEAAIEQVRAQFNPATADLLLPAWEFETKLPVGGVAGQSIAQRRAAVIGRLSKPFSGQGRDWEKSITAMVGPGWTYLEHDPNPPVDLVPNGSFEHDAVGALPASWDGAPAAQGGGAPVIDTYQVQAGWAKYGQHSLRMTAHNVDPNGNIVAGTTLLALGGSDVCSARLSYNVLDAGVTPLLQINFMDATGAYISTRDFAGPTGIGNGDIVAENVAVPAGATQFQPGAMLYNSSGAAGPVDGSFDGVAGFATGELPVTDYADGDSVGWRWTGTPGNSASEVDTPPDGVIRIIIPWQSGTVEFANAQTQIRDITDAHLEIELLSSAPFLLDSSQMDVAEFGV